MNITFINVSKKEQPRYIEAIKFYSSILMESNISEFLNIELHLSKSFKCPGQTLNDDFITDRPQYFKVEIRTKNTDVDPLLTLAHEMVHIKQYATGQLTLDFISDNIEKLNLNDIKVKPLWFGKTVQFRNCESPYWDSPWEIESYGRQDSLYERFLDWEEVNKNYLEYI